MFLSILLPPGTWTICTFIFKGYSKDRKQEVLQKLRWELTKGGIVVWVQVWLQCVQRTETISWFQNKWLNSTDNATEKSVWVFAVCNGQALILPDEHSWMLNIHPTSCLQWQFYFPLGIILLCYQWMSLLVLTSDHQVRLHRWAHEPNMVSVMSSKTDSSEMQTKEIKDKSRIRQILGKDFWVSESNYICVCYLWKFRYIR